MEPLTLLQVAIKDSIDVLYLSAEVPVNVLFVEDGSMGKTLGCIVPLCVYRKATFFCASFIYVNYANQAAVA